jgi:D-glycero-D-manno-heptose 1,7-bisphosphate phosphatase
MNFAIFFDRDGTLVVDHGYMSKPEQVELWEGAAAALRELQAHSYRLVVITNQSGIGRGLVTEEEAATVAARFEELLLQEGVRLDGVYACPHAPQDQCLCRKPHPTLLKQAAADLDIDLKRSYMVGDKITDCEAGEAAGCQSIWFVPEGNAANVKWPVARNFDEVLRIIQEDSRQNQTSKV